MKLISKIKEYHALIKSLEAENLKLKTEQKGSANRVSDITLAAVHSIADGKAKD